MDVAASMAVVCLGGRRFRFGEPSDIVAQLSKLMAEKEKQMRYVSWAIRGGQAHFFRHPRIVGFSAEKSEPDPSAVNA